MKFSNLSFSNIKLGTFNVFASLWQKKYFNPHGRGVGAVKFVNGGFVAEYNGILFSTIDGETIDVYPGAGGSDILHDGDNYIIVSGDEGNISYGNTLSDIELMSTLNITSNGDTILKMVYHAGLYVAYGFGSDNLDVIYTSSDFINWTKKTTPFTDGTGIISKLAISDSLGIVATSDSEIAFSDDIGLTWSVTPGNANSLKYLSNGLFAITANNSVRTSSNGTTWTSHSIPVAGDEICYDVEFDGVKYIIASTGDRNFITQNFSAFTNDQYPDTVTGELAMSYGNGIFVMSTTDNNGFAYFRNQ